MVQVCELHRWRRVLFKHGAMTAAPSAIGDAVTYAAMARAADVTVMPMHLLRATSGEPFFETDRFDRDGKVRVHVQRVAALLDADVRSATLDYLMLLKLARTMTRDQRVVDKMFRRMVCNARTLNRDDHLKNNAFLMDMSGVWALARPMI